MMGSSIFFALFTLNWETPALGSRIETNREKNSKIHLLSHEQGSEWMSEWMGERSRACEQSEQGRASEWVGGVSERANRRASGPVLQSVFLVVLAHSAPKNRDVSTGPLSSLCLGVGFLTLLGSSVLSNQYSPCCAHLFACLLIHSLSSWWGGVS